MYVIRSGSTGRHFPADRCSWVIQADSNGGYQISTGVAPDDDTPVNETGVALFYDGTDDNGTVIPGGTSNSTRPQLGYIGKSGRFVAITNP